MSKTLHPTTPASKPDKPYPEYPLFAHNAGVWAKKIRGKLHYFGPWGDPDTALENYLRDKDALHAGRKPRLTGDGLTVRDLCNQFLTAKRRKLDAGEMVPRTFGDYFVAAELLLASVDKDRLAADLDAADFGQLRAELAKGRGVHALANQIRRIRTIFKWGYDAGLLDRPMRFGPDFVQPGARDMRRARAARTRQTFEAAEIRAMLDKAGPAMQAMICLAANCGLGNTDVSTLNRSHLDLDAGVLDFPRPKTGIPRRCVLWTETVQAIRAALAVRPEPRDKADTDAVFVTKYGKRWVRHRIKKGEQRNVTTNAVTLEFRKVRDEAKVQADKLGFYGLRHSFRTIADEVPDTPAIAKIMGHEDSGDISTHYRHRISDARLKAVTDHVHGWLFPKPAKKKGSKKKVSK